MLFCDDCADARNWPKTAIRQRVACELCDEMTDCSEIPKADLPADDDSLAELKAELEMLKAKIASGAVGAARASNPPGFQGFE